MAEILTSLLAITLYKIGVVFSALMGGVSIMTWVERRLSAVIQFRWGPNRVGPFGLFQPAADGHIVPSDLYSLYDSGRFNDTPILLGNTSEEGASMGGIRDVTPEEFEKYHDVVGHIIYPAVREGKVLYDAA